MHKFIVVFFAVLVTIAATGVHQGKPLSKPAQEQYSVSVDQFAPAVIVENDVIMGNTLPAYGTLCEDVGVQGNPHDGFEVLYTLPAGEVVRLREQSRGADRSWVMIKPAHWIKISALCSWE